MPEFKRVRLANGTERTVSRVTDDMKVLDKPAVDAQGRPLPAKRKTTVDEAAGNLRGAALDEALDAADLPKTGSADEKRQRLAEHQSAASGENQEQ